MKHYHCYQKVWARVLFIVFLLIAIPVTAKSPDVIFRGRVFTDTNQPLPTGYRVEVTVNGLKVSTKVERDTGRYLIAVPREDFLTAFKEGTEIEITACDTEGEQLSKIEQVLEPIYLLQGADKKKVFIDLPEKKVIIPDQSSVKAFLFQGTLRTAEGYPALEGYTIKLSNTRTKQTITEKVDQRTGEYTATFIDIISTGPEIKAGDEFTIRVFNDEKREQNLLFDHYTLTNTDLANSCHTDFDVWLKD